MPEEVAQHDDGIRIEAECRGWNDRQRRAQRRPQDWQDWPIDRYYAYIQLLKQCAALMDDGSTPGGGAHGALATFVAGEPAPPLTHLPEGSWFLRLSIALTQPLYTSDNEPLPMDENVTLLDKALRAPCVPGTTIRGNLRYAIRATKGWWTERKAKEPGPNGGDGLLAELLGLSADDMRDDMAQVGRLHCYPVYFLAKPEWEREVITPLDAQTRFPPHGAVHYAVLREGAQGVLGLLYLPGDANQQQQETHLRLVGDGVKAMLYEYGFSAKRKIGWGTAEVIEGRLSVRGTHRDIGAYHSAQEFGGAFEAAIALLNGGVV